jgi:putative transposase
VLEDERLSERLREIHALNGKVDGSPRIHGELRLADGVRVGRECVERLMRQAAISGMVRCRRGRTTISVPGVRVCEDFIDRRFLAAAPDRLWVADITYLRTWEGWLYLVAVQDVFSRRRESRAALRGLRLHRGLLQPPPPAPQPRLLSPEQFEAITHHHQLEKLQTA